MKFKTALAAVVIALSSHASFAATDTSCNPFERGANCNGAVSVGSSGAAFAQFRGFSAPRGFQAPSFRRSETRGFGRFMRSVSSPVRQQIVVIDDRDDFDTPEKIVEIKEVVDGGTNVAVVPVPAAGFLLLAGLGGLVALRRKKS